MLNQMHKYVNHLSRKKLFAVEKDEHNLKNTPTEQQLLAMEKREHKLNTTPTMSKLLKIEKKNMVTKKHPGFKAVQQKIASQQGVSLKSAGAILASSTRKASAAAKKKNPRLNRVK